MEYHENADAVAQHHEPWNKGKLIGQSLRFGRNMCGRFAPSSRSAVERES